MADKGKVWADLFRIILELVAEFVLTSAIRFWTQKYTVPFKKKETKVTLKFHHMNKICDHHKMSPSKQRNSFSL